MVDLAADGSRGRLRARIASPAFAFPTATAVLGEPLLVVNAQLDRMGATPELPFTVVAVAAT